MTAYIYASRGAATRRQRITLGSVIFALVLSIALAIFGLVSSQQAQDNLRLSRQTQSLFLAELSRQQQESEHYRSALLLALEAVQYFPTIQNGESLRALLNSLSGPQQELIALPHQAESETGLATVTGVRWSQDESRILSVFGNNVLIWDSSSGDIVLTLQHDDTARGGLWNQDNTRILTWSADGTARVWDPFIENQLLTLVHDAPVSGALWIPEQGRIVTWVEGPDVHIWDANTGDELLTLNYGGSSQVGDVQLRGNNLLVRVGSALHLWTLADGSDGIETTQHLRMDHGAAVRGMAWNPAGDRILSWSDDQTVRIWNAADGQQVERQNHSEAVEGAIWSPDGQSVLYWSRNVPPVLWDFASQQTCSIGSADNTVQGAAWAADSAHFATWTRSGALSIWTVPDPMSADACANAVPQTLNFDRAVEGARWSADGSRILGLEPGRNRAHLDAGHRRHAGLRPQRQPGA